jgi:predicted acylesterase/phospholipase RssA
MIGRRRRAAGVAVGALLIGGCYPRNPLLIQTPPRHEPSCCTDPTTAACTAPYRFECVGAAAAETDPDETFVVLTFSGGGTRAAAFAFGAMEALRDTQLPDGRQLVDEVDVISSVSGGSFASAYYALFGKQRFFDQFHEAVLDRDLELGYGARVAAPWNWPRLLSPDFARSDLASEYYDSVIFEGRTFAAMPRHRPFVVLNATDIGRGAGFAFTQDQFDRICSDLDGVHVARAVTASSAFPVAFTPLTLKNYGAGACHYDPPEWVQNAEADPDANPQLFDLARTWRSYEDAAQRPYIHLSDGGLADNIGLRGVERAILEPGGLPGLQGPAEVKRLVVIVVDAKPRTAAAADRCARPPGIFTVLNAAATNPMENYSSDTVERMQERFEEVRSERRSGGLRFTDCDAIAAQRCGEATPCVAREQAACRQVLLDGCVQRGPDLWPTECAADSDAATAACFRLNCEDVLTATRREAPELYLIHLRFDAIPDEDAKRTLQGVDTRLHLSPAEVDLLTLWGRRLLATAPEYQRLMASLGASLVPTEGKTVRR